MSLNRAQIIGNLTRDPELRQTATGQSVCSFGVATNRVYTDREGQKQEQVEYHNIVAWARLAEICNQYLGKGRKVFVEGRLQTREWEGQDGVKRRSTEIVADTMIMLDRAPAGGGVAPTPQAAAPPVQPAVPQPAVAAPEAIPTISYDEPTVDNTAPPAPTEPGVTEEEVKVEDIPF